MDGLRFGILNVKEFDKIDGKSRQARWICVCDCGTETSVAGRELRSGNTKSCGCQRWRRRPQRDENERKACIDCGELKAAVDFTYSRAKDKYKEHCRECGQRRSAERAKWNNRARRADGRAAALNAYGGECVCCGESIQVFLQFDHINGGGNQHRGQIKRRRFATMASWLINEGYPKGFQILCANCNWAKHANGICPHQIDHYVGQMSFGA